MIPWGGMPPPRGAGRKGTCPYLNLPVFAESDLHNLDAPYLARQRCRGKTVLHEHLWDRSPFVCPVRGRRVHEEQIVVSTRAVYPGSGRGGRVKPYSCLACIRLESSGA